MRFEIIFFKEGWLGEFLWFKNSVNVGSLSGVGGMGGVQSVGKKSVSGHLNDLLGGWLSR